eukprot:COSAG05_NODE_3487_length_2031_cov_1.538820_3_plen_182_part_01
MTSGPGCYSTGWGWTVINILGAFGLSYLVVGVAYQATMLVRAGKPLIVGGRPSWALVPHAIFWVALSGLLRDGLTFTVRCGGNGRLGTTGVVDSNDTQQRGSVTSFSGSSGKRQSRKDKKKKKNSKRKSDLETPLSNTAEPPSVVKSGEDGGGDQAVEWKPTRTGNLLAAGARETGVKVQM